MGALPHTYWVILGQASMPNIVVYYPSAPPGGAPLCNSIQCQYQCLILEAYGTVKKNSRKNEKLSTIVSKLSREQLT
ncbi:hypothetical protein PsorP6_000744 [Peronosclerospora sorghi]|uniref:Uncharacterized protein n=1 Tax=Peronosclerospora sorghi TaxID=230839 RepID=A0ACC0WUK7_9STRA|nr:hypothetical protein PsorP6_000744 [Peronosclerospora sorghi]